jgi:RNA polymerase sigma-70 factor, ECF subfamily
MDDNKLVEKIIRDQSQDAFKELVVKYQNMVINTCYGFVHNYDDAQDIAQEVFVEVHRSINKFRQESKLSTWLYRISANKSINYLRDHKKNKWLFNLDLLFEKDDENPERIGLEESPQEILEKDEKSDILYKAIDSLPENQKMAFTLYKYDDLSYKEIGEVMDLSLSSVESLMFRAKKNLQKKLISIYKKKLNQIASFKLYPCHNKNRM